MMRRPSASALITFSNSHRFSAPIRPLSLMTTSPFAALVILSIQPPEIFACGLPCTCLNGNHSAKRKLLKLQQLMENGIDEVSQLAKIVQTSCCAAVESHVRRRVLYFVAKSRGNSVPLSPCRLRI